MVLLVDGHPYHYEMENLCRVFLPYEEIKTVFEIPEALPETQTTVYTGLRQQGGQVYISVRLHLGGRVLVDSRAFPESVLQMDKEAERLMAVMLFELFAERCGYRPQWGILTGVRPIKLLRRLCGQMGREQAIGHFTSGFLVTPEKTRLSVVTMDNEQKILSKSRPESYSLYISIPFCPTRCAYCSFVSQSVDKAIRLMPEYVSLLCKELEHTAKVAGELGLRLESVYIGGGTPTTLSPEQLHTLLDTLCTHFPVSSCREFTVEAGRPDTVTPERLQVLKEFGVTRISINPQTMNDEILERIGRRHTTAQTVSAFELSRKMGFDNINMDLIVGLPGDTVEGYRSTLEHVLRLDPESVTVHTLALKRSSRLNQSERDGFDPDAAAAAQMLDDTAKSLFSSGYEPYYLYRQSRMVGNLENTGWAKPGCYSDYNVYIMDETHTILACGAGAVSKVKDPYSDTLRRIFNFKFPYEYVSRHEEMIARKEQVKELYELFRK